MGAANNVCAFRAIETSASAREQTLCLKQQRRAQAQIESPFGDKDERMSAKDRLCASRNRATETSASAPKKDSVPQATGPRIS